MADFTLKKNIRVFLALGILAGSSVFAFWIMGNANKAAYQAGNQRKQLLALTDAARKGTEQKNPVAGQTQNQNQNATEELIRRYGDEAYRLNKDRIKPGTDNKVVLPDENFLAGALERATKERLIMGEFSRTDLRINANPTEEDVGGYADKFQEVLKSVKTGGETNFLAAVYEAAGTGSYDALKKHEVLASGVVDNLLNMSVPEPMTDFHLIFLNVWEGRLGIARAVLNGESDPVGSMAAVNRIEDQVLRENQAVAAFEKLNKYLDSF